MKATLTFTLPDEEYEFQCAKDGSGYRRTLSDINECLRSITKHGATVPHGATLSEWQDAAEHLRTVLWELLRESNLTID